MPFWEGRPVLAVESIDDGRAADERVLEHLATLGCDPAAPLESTHYVYLPRRGGADAVAEVLHREGWLTRVECGIDDSWLVVAGRVCALSSAHVRVTRSALEALAAEHGGQYDGWEVKT
jgi:hypothetical protein